MVEFGEEDGELERGWTSLEEQTLECWLRWSTLCKDIPSEQLVLGQQTYWHTEIVTPTLELTSPMAFLGQDEHAFPVCGYQISLSPP